MNYFKRSARSKLCASSIALSLPAKTLMYSYDHLIRSYCYPRRSFDHPESDRQRDNVRRLSSVLVNDESCFPRRWLARWKTRRVLTGRLAPAHRSTFQHFNDTDFHTLFVPPFSTRNLLWIDNMDVCFVGLAVTWFIAKSLCWSYVYLCILSRLYWSYKLQWCLEGSLVANVELCDSRSILVFIGFCGILVERVLFDVILHKNIIFVIITNALLNEVA